MAPSVLVLNGEVLAYGRQLAPGRLVAPKPSQPALVPGDESGPTVKFGSIAEGEAVVVGAASVVKVVLSDNVDVVLVVEDSVREDVEDPVVGRVEGADATVERVRLRLLSCVAWAALTLKQRPSCLRDAR